MISSELSMSNETLTINKDMLCKALIAWNKDYRRGDCLTHEESAAHSIEEVATESTDYLWGLLSNEQSMHTPTTLSTTNQEGNTNE